MGHREISPAKLTRPILKGVLPGMGQAHPFFTLSEKRPFKGITGETQVVAGGTQYPYSAVGVPKSNCLQSNKAEE